MLAPFGWRPVLLGEHMSQPKRPEKTEAKWFEYWIRGYRRFLRVGPPSRLPVDQDNVIAFLRSLRDQGRKAWQRLQALRAISDYARRELPAETSHLQPLEAKLLELVRSESGRPCDEPDGAGDALIDPTEPEIVQKLRKEIRLQHKSLSTETAYARPQSVPVSVRRESGREG